MSTDATPPYSTEMDHVQDLGRVVQLTYALRTKLDLLPDLLAKINKSSLTPINQQALTKLQDGATAIRSSYGNSFINVRKLATTLEYRVERFLGCLDMIRNPNVGKSKLVTIFTRIIRDTNFDPEALKRDMAEFEGIAGKVNDLSNQSTDFVLSGTEGIIAKRNAVDDEARSEKANLRDLEKKLADLSGKTGGLLQRATPLHGHDEEMAKLERAIAGSKAKIRQLDCEVEDLCKATETLRAVSDEFNSETKDIISSLHLCPKEISSTVAKIYAQIALDAKGFLYAIEHDTPITEDTISEVKTQYNHIKDALHALATR